MVGLKNVNDSIWVKYIKTTYEVCSIRNEHKSVQSNVDHRNTQRACQKVCDAVIYIVISPGP